MKEELRKYFQTRRKGLDKEAKHTLSSKAQDIFLSSGLYKSAKNIMVYMPLGNETDTDKIIFQCFRDNKTVLLPVTDKNNYHMDAAILTPESTLIKGAFSVKEPHNAKLFDKARIDLVIVPGVAFSQSGARIGFGKGCYDRFLADMSAKKIGLCYEFQMTEQVKCDEHDVKMDYIVTEKEIYDCEV